MKTQSPATHPNAEQVQLESLGVLYHNRRIGRQFGLWDRPLDYGC